jgi:mRNA-degrading endonuclease YafQ of YafQ-DinJ toxin-antitoxin module
MSHKNEHKAIIIEFLLEKAKLDLLSGMEAHKNNRIEKEIQIGININLLLGIAIEGIANDIGEHIMGDEWKDIEKCSILAKWIIIFKLKGKEVDKGRKPLQVFDKLRSLRNKIAHPKLELVENDIILISKNGQWVKNPSDDYKLPDGDIAVYIGYGDFYDKFNISNTLKNMKEALESIKDVMGFLPNTSSLSYCNGIYDEIKNIRFRGNQLTKK